MRPLARPRRRWVDNIKMYIRKIQWGGLTWIGIAQDRDKWKAVVNMAMNHRLPYNFGKFFSSCTTGNSSKRSQLREASLVQEYLLCRLQCIERSNFHQDPVRCTVWVKIQHARWARYTQSVPPVKVTDSHGWYSSAVPLVAGSPTAQQPTMSLHGVPNSACSDLFRGRSEFYISKDHVMKATDMAR
jgi:hypothetical protein